MFSTQTRHHKPTIDQPLTTSPSSTNHFHDPQQTPNGPPGPISNVTMVHRRPVAQLDLAISFRQLCTQLRHLDLRIGTVVAPGGVTGKGKALWPFLGPLDYAETILLWLVTQIELPSISKHCWNKLSSAKHMVNIINIAKALAAIVIVDCSLKKTYGVFSKSGNPKNGWLVVLMANIGWSGGSPILRKTHIDGHCYHLPGMH